MATKPLNIRKLLNLDDFGFNSSCYKFGAVTLESDRFICIKEAEASTPSVTIIDIYNENSVSKKPMKADASIMNPDKPIIALRAPTETGHFIQVFHLETKEKLGTHQFNERIAFWRWISTSELAVVTDTSVYHWSVAQGGPKSMFDRDGKLADAATKIVGYETDEETKWCILYGIYSSDQGSTIEGSLQLYSMERRQQQFLEGYAATFANIRVMSDSLDKTGLLVFCEHKRGTTSSKLHVMDIYTKKTEGGKAPFRVSKDITMAIGSAGDFPIATYVLDSCGIACIVNKSGIIQFHDVATASFLFSEQLSTSPLFVSCPKRNNGKQVGALVINRKGEVLDISINEEMLLKCISPDLAVGIATCFGLPGSEAMLRQSFDDLFQRKEYKKAALVVVTLKSQELRNAATIERFKNAPAVPGQPSPASHYFSVLLEYGKLTHLESLELVKPAIAQKRAEFVRKWMEQDKLTESEELGDLIRQIDAALAFKIFTKLGSHLKAILCLLDANQVAKVVPFIKKVSQNLPRHTTTNAIGDVIVVIDQFPPISVILENVLEMSSHVAVSFIKDLLAGFGPQESLCDIMQITEMLLRHKRIDDLTSILLDYLKPNLPQHAQLQTRLLEINLKESPKAAEMIFQLNVLTHFDKEHIARLCENAGLYGMALVLFSDISDLKRVIKMNANDIKIATLEKVLTAASKEDATELFHAMFDSQGIPQDVLLSSALSLQKKVDPLVVADIIKSRGDDDMLFQFLRALPIIMSRNASSSPSDSILVSRYAECCIQQGQYDALEYLIKESNIIDLNATKDLLKTVDLPNPKCLMIVCHRLGAIQELTEYLYHNGQEKYIEMYVNSVNPLGVSQVVSTLFDLGAPESIIFGILENLRDPSGMRAMIKVADERHQLCILTDWLKRRIADGYKDPEIHTAYMKILVSSQNPEASELLRTNMHYDRAALGQFCENRDPQLAFLIYSQGDCDNDVVRLCKANGLLRQMAKYALERQSIKLWALIFDENNESRDQQDVARLCEELKTLLTECTSSQVSCVLKALMEAGMNIELIGLLEQILLNDTQFASNVNLQNLLLATTLRNDPSRLDEYLLKLDKYDISSLSKLATSLGLHKCCFSLLKARGKHAEALDALLNEASDEALESARAHVEEIDSPNLWFRLGRAYLDNGSISEAIDAYLKSGNVSDHDRIMEACGDNVNLLLRWLRQGRRAKSNQLDNDLLITLATSGNIDEYCSILQGDHHGNAVFVGDKLYKLGMYKEAVYAFNSTTKNYAKLSMCYLHLKDYQEASDAALKSRNPQVLEQMMNACMQQEQLEIAKTAALALLAYQDFLQSVTRAYEKGGHFENYIELLTLAQPNVATRTELAIALAKYQPRKLMAHLKQEIEDKSNLNNAKLAKECCNLWLWKEAIFLYSIDSPDKALSIMAVHSPSAWDEEMFFTCCKACQTSEPLYKALQLLMTQHPMLIPKFLKLGVKIEPTIVIRILKPTCLALAREYLESIQNPDRTVLEALCDIYIQMELWQPLGAIIEQTNDMPKLAHTLEDHRMLNMRLIAARIYFKSLQQDRAAEIYYKNGNYHEAMHAILASRNEGAAINMLKRFLSDNLTTEFAAACIIFSEIVNISDVLELAWINKVNLDIIMPCIIQATRAITSSKQSKHTLALGWHTK
ncbi:bifunctional Clathrin [Babesia duncani]|uniref:Clathrin heavy chain n=1 Tax=Babesia duncani TaxID=323732 RepID=A0AAD9PJU9_9APIC|nr:bifunctional Clathrin [Babesia duncani]